MDPVVAEAPVTRDGQGRFVPDAARRGEADEADRASDAPAGHASPAFDLHPSGEPAVDPEARTSPTRPLNRHERRRAAALQRAAAGPTPFSAVA